MILDLRTIQILVDEEVPYETVAKCAFNVMQTALYQLPSCWFGG